MTGGVYFQGSGLLLFGGGSELTWAASGGVASGRWDLSVAVISSLSNPHEAVFSPERPTLCSWRGALSLAK